MQANKYTLFVQDMWGDSDFAQREPIWKFFAEAGLHENVRNEKRVSVSSKKKCWMMQLSTVAFGCASGDWFRRFIFDAVEDREEACFLC